MILFLGWDMYRKGVDIAVKAMSEFRKTHPTAQLALLGFGENPTDEQCSWILEKTGIDPRQTPWLRFFPGCEDMFAVHRASDVFLSASRREAFPYGLLEAISQNIPIAAGEIDGTRWSRAYNKCILYPVESVEACVESLNKALEMRFAPSNQDELMDIYGIEPWCTKVMDIYEIVMK